MIDVRETLTVVILPNWMVYVPMAHPDKGDNLGLYCFDASKKDISVDDMGTIHYPEGTMKWKKRFTVPPMVARRFRNAAEYWTRFVDEIGTAEEELSQYLEL